MLVGCLGVAVGVERKIFFRGFTCANVQGVIGFYGYLCGNVSIYAGLRMKRVGVEGVEVLPLSYD
jgi:hypothetical protein